MSLFPEIDAAQEAEAAQAKATEKRYREHEADFTPRGIVRPLVARIMPLALDRYENMVANGLRERGALRVLGLCSGPGVWESEVLRWCVEHGIDVHITGVEIREEEREHLQRHTHETVIGDWHEPIGMVFDGERWIWEGERPHFDLGITNPAFKQLRSPRRPGWPAQRKSADGSIIKPTTAERRIRKQLIEDAIAEGKHAELAQYDPDGSMPALVLQVAEIFAAYSTTQCLVKTAAGWLVREAYPCTRVTDVPGAVGHRGRGRGQDQISYSLFTWFRGCKPIHALLDAIDPPSSDDRNWSMRPGTEPPEWLRANGIPYLDTVDGVRVLVRTPG